MYIKNIYNLYMPMIKKKYKEKEGTPPHTHKIQARLHANALQNIFFAYALTYTHVI